MAHKFTALRIEVTCWTLIIVLLLLNNTQISIKMGHYQFFTIISLFYGYTVNIVNKRVQPKRSSVMFGFCCYMKKILTRKSKGTLWIIRMLNIGHFSRWLIIFYTDLCPQLLLTTWRIRWSPGCSHPSASLPLSRTLIL